MNSLPYIEPNRELSLNLGLLLILLESLAVTKKEKRVLNLDKTQLFFYLLLNPVIMNRVLILAGKKEINMRENEYYTVSSMSSNVDALFDREKIKDLFKVLASKELIEVTYSAKEGFLFELNERGISQSQSLNDNYFSLVRKYTKQLETLRSFSIGKLNGFINMVLRTGVASE